MSRVCSMIDVLIWTYPTIGLVAWFASQSLLTLPIPWKSKTKQRMVFRMIHVKESLLPMGKVWSLDFLGIASCF